MNNSNIRSTYTNVFISDVYSINWHASYSCWKQNCIFIELLIFLTVLATTNFNGKHFLFVFVFRFNSWYRYEIPIRKSLFFEKTSSLCRNKPLNFTITSNFRILFSKNQIYIFKKRSKNLKPIKINKQATATKTKNSSNKSTQNKSLLRFCFFFVIIKYFFLSRREITVGG